MADELDLIAAEAAQLEADTSPAMPGEETPEVGPVADPAAEWRDATRMGCSLVVSVYPELKTDWTDERLDNLGNALAKCAERYGWTVAELFGHPLVGLAFATWPLAVPLVKVAKERAEAKKREKGRQGVAMPNRTDGSIMDRPGTLGPSSAG